jgi:cell wall assembly regulator SMI1
MDSIASDWQRIEHWLQAFAPQVWAGLNPGIAEGAIQQEEAVIGVPLPEDFKASYRLHDGSRSVDSLTGGFNFSPLHNVVSGNEESYVHGLLQDPSWAENEPEYLADLLHPPLLIQPVWRHPLWLTFAIDGGDGEWCLDLAPARDGQVGQIITWDHEVGPERVLFPSFAALLSTYADGLEAGLFLGGPPQFPIEQLTHLEARRQAFQEPSPAKPLLWQAIQRAWRSLGSVYPSVDVSDYEESMAALEEVLHWEEATIEDRLFASYCLISYYLTEGDHDEASHALAQLEAEARVLPATHWVHEEVTLWKSFHRELLR